MWPSTIGENQTFLGHNVNTKLGLSEGKQITLTNVRAIAIAVVAAEAVAFAEEWNM